MEAITKKHLCIILATNSWLNLAKSGILVKGGNLVLLFTKFIFSSNSDKELISHQLI